MNDINDLLDIWEGVDRTAVHRTAAPDEVDDGPPRERCPFCGGDPMAFTACCPAEETDETVWVDSEGNE